MFRKNARYDVAHNYALYRHMPERERLLYVLRNFTLFPDRVTITDQGEGRITQFLCSCEDVAFIEELCAVLFDDWKPGVHDGPLFDGSGSCPFRFTFR